MIHMRHLAVPLLSAMLVLSACGGGDTGDASGETRGVTADNGTIDVPVDPNRVATLGNTTLPFIDLGGKPVGVTAESDSAVALLPEDQQETYASATILAPSADEVDLEKLASLEPDLILVQIPDAEFEALEEQLEVIAPTVFFGLDTEWKALADGIAEAGAATDALRAQKAEFEEKVATIQETYGAIVEGTSFVDVIRWASSDPGTFAIADIGCSEIARDDVGMNLPEAPEGEDPLAWTYLRTGPEVYRTERAAMSARAQQIVESQRGYATVLGFGRGDRRHRTMLAASWAVAVQAVRARTVQSMLNARLNLGECLSLAAVLVVGFVLIDRGASTVGGATTAMLLVLRVLGPVNQLMFVVDTLQSALASLNRMVGVTTIRTEGTAHETPTPDVRLRGVAFGYGSGPRVLDDITLDIPAGERIAVVGASGAGKTTLAAVIAGVHPPDAGTVARPEHTAVITQEIHVFAGPLRDNLTLAAPHATDGEVRAALRSTGAVGWLDLLPDGLDTVVGTGGHPLTDAQAQQLALARLLLADPQLAILDEATAEAGSTQSGLLDRAADAVLAGRTGLVIAHRLSQAAACDRIVVMEHGRITESGTHTDLIAAGGVYAGLWSAWQRGAAGSS